MYALWAYACMYIYNYIYIDAYKNGSCLPNIFKANSFKI